MEREVLLERVEIELPARPERDLVTWALEPDRLLLAADRPVLEEALGGAMLASAPARGVLLIAAPAAIDRRFDATHLISKRHPEPLGRAILRGGPRGWRASLG